MKVSELIFEIKNSLEGNLKFRDIWVEGELSEVKIYQSSNSIYFKLKENDYVLSCYLGKLYYYKLEKKVQWQDGKKVRMKGSITLWNKGEMKFFVQDGENDLGLGEKYIQLEKLKQKLKNEGLFDAKYKKNIPLFPEKIGIITSLQGAVIHDIYDTMKKNGSLLHMIIFPSIVQGNEAPNQLIHALKEADQLGLDLLIIARGGGSAEDLWCFQDEQLARTIFDLKTPIISAVGHETDITICDLVADLRSPTPTAAANQLPKFYQQLDQLISYEENFIKHIQSLIQKHQTEFSNFYQSIHDKFFSTLDKSKDFLQSTFNQLYSDIKYQILSHKNNLDTIQQVIFNSWDFSLNESKRFLDNYSMEMANQLMNNCKYLRTELEQNEKELSLPRFFKAINQQKELLNNLTSEFNQYLKITLSNELIFIDNQKDKLIYLMQSLIENQKLELKNLSSDLEVFVCNLLKEEKMKLEQLSTEMDSVDHQKLLSKGYSITLNHRGEVIKSIEQVNMNEKIQTILLDGVIQSIIEKFE